MVRHKSSSWLRREIYASYDWLKTELHNPTTPPQKRLRVLNIIKKLNQSTRQRPRQKTQLVCPRCGVNITDLRIRIHCRRRITTCKRCGMVQRFPLQKIRFDNRKP